MKVYLAAKHLFNKLILCHSLKKCHFVEFFFWKCSSFLPSSVELNFWHDNCHSLSCAREVLVYCFRYVSWHPENFFAVTFATNESRSCNSISDIGVQIKSSTQTAFWQEKMGLFAKFKISILSLKRHKLKRWFLVAKMNGNLNFFTL